ncbi:MAG: hypothetical protein KDA36_09265 [Planctomycetaceae bacterium]|nr:hypothetical protein [Planctomycetaceae bacterium]MCA9098564.1 hypothetical protein [Planctomycetaceae bacterium]
MPEDQIDRIIESLSQINVSLENLRVSLLALAETCADHEERIRAIERWKNSLTPLLASMTFILGAIFSAAVNHLF